MQWLTPCFLGPLLRLTLLTALIMPTGCRTAPEAPLFTATGPGWHVEQGQALWRPGRNFPELGGELVVVTGNEGRCMIQFVKTPVPMVLAQTTPAQWRMEFPPRRMAYTGPKPAPIDFTWLFIPAALAAEPLPDGLRFERKANDSWRLENTRSGETVEGFLGP